MPWRPAHQAEYKFSREAIFIDTLKPAEHTKRLKTQIGCWPQFPMYRGLSLWRVRGWFCLGFFLWIGAAARAQDLRGSLLVTAEDTTGGRIAGAIVTLTQEKSEGKRTARADTRGEARFDALQPGGYRVTIEANGFEEKTARVVVAVSSQPTLILALAPQTVQQSVQVRDRGPSLASQPIETTSSEIKTEIAAEDLDEVPLSARSFANISLMAPFTAPVEPSDPTKARITAVSFGGSSGLNVDLSVDGGDNNDDYIGGFLQNFSPEAVQEFVVRTAQFGADTSRTNGGSVIISTRSGTNDWHGSLSYFYRGKSLNARNALDNPEPNPKQPFSRQNGVATFGGPIKHGKLWFFSRQFPEAVRRARATRQRRLDSRRQFHWRDSHVGGGAVSRHVVFHARGLGAIIPLAVVRARFTGSQSHAERLGAASGVALHWLCDDLQLLQPSPEPPVSIHNGVAWLLHRRGQRLSSQQGRQFEPGHRAGVPVHSQLPDDVGARNLR